MTITARELNRATLARQLLLDRESLGITDAVRRVVALQAQNAASPYIALWNRIKGLDPSDEHRKHVTRSNGDVLPTLLVDGYVAGVWRPAEGGVEAVAFQELPDEVWQRLADKAGALTAFLAEREPRVYRRFNHWWAKLPNTEVRMLPA
jgi:hypothetical protein